MDRRSTWNSLLFKTIRSSLHWAWSSLKKLEVGFGCKSHYSAEWSSLLKEGSASFSSLSTGHNCVGDITINRSLTSDGKNYEETNGSIWRNKGAARKRQRTPASTVSFRTTAALRTQARTDLLLTTTAQSWIKSCGLLGTSEPRGRLAWKGRKRCWLIFLCSVGSGYRDCPGHRIRQIPAPIETTSPSKSPSGSFHPHQLLLCSSNTVSSSTFAHGPQTLQERTVSPPSVAEGGVSPGPVTLVHSPQEFDNPQTGPQAMGEDAKRVAIWKCHGSV